MELITTEEFARMLSTSKSSLYRLRGSAGFPKPIYLNNKSVRYRLDEIIEFINKLPRER
ncbi:helix-turn-helix transcriptional regulator [Chitinilyticum litopenaei]|uniref:helix-turn-helix transcriptional regulator n=1 Tax=Chitinilyticum litopenaei TaxID=1121276 RepID=UPI0009DB96B1